MLPNVKSICIELNLVHNTRKSLMWRAALNRTQVYSNVNRMQQPPTEWHGRAVNQALGRHNIF